MKSKRNTPRKVRTKSHPTFSYFIGGTKVETTNINSLKEIVCEISEKLGKSEELSKHISDFIFDVEKDYQVYHGLHEDDWSMVH